MKQLWALAIAGSLVGCSSPTGVTIASKQDAETTILAEMAVQLARPSGANVRHNQGLGGTPVVWQALQTGDVDAYPEYTGTLALQILHDPSLKDETSLRTALAKV